MEKDVISFVKDIETRYPVNEIKYDNLPLWPFIRIMIFDRYFFKDEFKSNKGASRFQIIKKISKEIWHFLLSWKRSSLSLLKKKNCDYFFSSTLETREVNSELIDKSLNELTKISRSFVPIIMVNFTQKTAFKEVVYRNYINYIIKLQTFFEKINNEKFAGLSILKNICSKLNISFNLNKVLKLIIVSQNYYKRLFIKTKPSRIFLTCYYDFDKLPMIYAAKNLNIPVIEFEHGLINRKHYAYNIFSGIKNNPYPDYLFVYGNRFKDCVSENIYPQEKIKIVGNYYLELMKKEFSINKAKFELKYADRIKNKTVITVASQYTVDKELLLFFSNLTKVNKDIFVIYKPRPFEAYQKEFESENLVIETELDTYLCIQNSHILSTVYSTCAVEALYFEVPVLCVDINHLAETFIKESLENLSSVKFIEKESEAVSAIKELLSVDKENLNNEGRLFYAENHSELLRVALKSLAI